MAPCMTKTVLRGSSSMYIPKRHIALQGLKLVLPYIQSYYLGFSCHHMRSKLFHAMFKQAEVSEIDAYAKRYAELLIKGLNPALCTAN